MMIINGSKFVNVIAPIILFLVIFIYNYLGVEITTKTKNTVLIEGKGSLRNTTSWKPFNETNRNTNWCPAATCHNSPVCSPCNRRFLFILATGRSGSTSILQTLDELPGVQLSGESDHVLFKLWKLTNTEKMEHILSQNFDRVGAWKHNAIPQDSMACSIQHFIHTLNPPPLTVQQQSNILPVREYERSVIMGAKLIRIQADNWSPKEAAEFFDKNFPCSKIIVNIRSDFAAQVESITNSFKAVNEEEDEKTEEIQRKTDYLISLAKEFGEDRARIIDMIDWSKDVGVLNDAIEWLGFQNCTLKHILHNNVGDEGYGQDEYNGSLYEPSCRYPY